MKFKGTKGEWLTTKKVGCGINIRIKSQEVIVADGYSFASGISDEEAEANAKLIAAAPDLLEALQSIVSEIKEQSFPDEWDGYKKALSAINKALK